MPFSSGRRTTSVEASDKLLKVFVLDLAMRLWISGKIAHINNFYDLGQKPHINNLYNLGQKTLINNLFDLGKKHIDNLCDVASEKNT